jgi:hypothetical protein
MPYNYTNDERRPDWKPTERKEVYIKVKPKDREYSELIIPIPYKIYDADSRTLNSLLEQVKITFTQSRVTVLISFPKKGNGHILHMDILLEQRKEDLDELIAKVKPTE